MNQTELKIKNDMLAKISALKAVNEGLKLLDDKEFKKQMESNKIILEKLEDKLAKFEKKLQDERLAKIKRQQEESQKILKDEIVFIGKYFAHLGKLKIGDEPDPEMLAQFNRIKRKAHVIHHLRKMNLKGI